MDDQALLEGIVVFSDEDGPVRHEDKSQCQCVWGVAGDKCLFHSIF